jgi:hypothetical protein
MERTAMPYKAMARGLPDKKTRNLHATVMNITDTSMMDRSEYRRCSAFGFKKENRT